MVNAIAPACVEVASGKVHPDWGDVEAQEQQVQQSLLQDRVWCR